MFGTSREVFVYNQTKGTFLAFRVGVADSILGRLIGLLGRKSLKPDGGVWIVPANAIHTVGMLFSFDVVMPPGKSGCASCSNGATGMKWMAWEWAPHGLMRMLNDDWNDGLLSVWAQRAFAECVAQGESVLNSAMAAWVFDLYARLLTYAGEADLAAQVRRSADAQRAAAAQQWTGKWLRRASLGPTLWDGWEKARCGWSHSLGRCWGGSTTMPEQSRELVRVMDELLRRPSPIGAVSPAFHPDNSEMAHIPKPSGVMDLKTMAISRMMLDNFPHIKAYWVMLGLKTAQVVLSFGADDLDGTVVHEKIYHDAGAETPQEATVAEIRRLITEAGRVPIERDTLYHQVVRNGSRWSSGEHIDVPALAGVGSARD